VTFLAPAMLWSLAALLPLVAIYFLKVRPRRKPTTAFFLWEKIFQQKRTSSLFQRLRNLWSLLLMALAAAAICFALGRPEWADDRQDLLILIDRSASMGAKEGRSTRFDLAKKLAADIVEGLNGNQRASIATVGHRLTFLSHLTDNPRELLDAIAQANPSQETLDWKALLSVGKRLSTDKEESSLQRLHRVVLISDGNFSEHALPETIELLKIGTPQENIGLVAADMAYLPSGENQLAFYYQIASSFESQQQIDLTVARLDDSGTEQLKKVIPLTVLPGLQPPEVFTLDDAQPGRWIARLEVEDALASDNTAQLAAIRPPPIRVAVDASDPFFFENSIVAFSQGTDLLTLVTGRSPDGTNTNQEDEKSVHVTLAKGSAPEVPRAIVFQPEGEGPWWSNLGEEVATGAPRVLVEGHPALRHLDPTAISFVGARQLTPIEGAQVLVADENDLPLIYKATRGDRSVLVVNIDPLAADFYFSAWFPVLIHSAATHLVGREWSLAASYRPGDAIPIPGATEESLSQFTLSRWQPDGEQLSAASSEKSEVRGKWYSEANRIGFYEIENSSGTWPVGVSLLADEESLLTDSDTKSTEKPLSRGFAPAYLLTVLAIVVLAAESILYHRRKVG